jgi:hypothetical protein
MKSVSAMPILRSVLRMVGQVPSPTPMVPRLTLSTSVTATSGPWRAAISAAVSHPAEPPPTMHTEVIARSGVRSGLADITVLLSSLPPAGWGAKGTREPMPARAPGCQALLVWMRIRS